MIWIRTVNSSTITFNALNSNNLTVYPIYCKQYISSSWITKEIKIYQDSSWNDFFVTLYNKGNECTSITGGWTIEYTPEGTGSIKTDSNGEQYIYIASSINNGVYNSYFITQNAIDVTDYSDICVTVTDTGNYGIFCGLFYSKDLYAGFAARKDIALGENILDISTVSGSYYVVIGTSPAGGYGSFNNVTLY